MTGTSTGALIAPFAALGQGAVKYVASWYQRVTTSYIYGFHLGVWNGVYHWGYPSRAHAEGCFLYLHYAQVLQNFKATLGEDPLRALSNLWNPDDPAKRKIVAAATIDFQAGRNDYVSNCERDLPPEDTNAQLYHSRFYDGIFASTVPPLIGEPVPLSSSANASGVKTHHYDGGPYAEAPFDLLFRLAAANKINLTHVVLISSYPCFPGSDDNPAQEVRYPKNALFLKTAARFDSLLSESAVTTGYRLACLTLQTASSMTTEERRKLRTQTGLEIPLDVRVPILVGVFPSERQGYDPNRFKETEMKTMYCRGKSQSRGVYEAYFH